MLTVLKMSMERALWREINIVHLSHFESKSLYELVVIVIEKSQSTFMHLFNVLKRFRR